MLNESFLPCVVAMIHAAYLGNGHVRLINKNKKVTRKVINKCKRGISCVAAGNVPRIIFNAGAVSGGTQHFHVKPRALPQAFRFQNFSLPLKFFQMLFKFLFNGGNGVFQHTLSCDKMLCRKQFYFLCPSFIYGFNFVSKKF